MSVATYIGLNFEVAICDEMNDLPIEVMYCFSEEENRLAVRESHFKTPFVYELWEEAYPSFKHMTEYNKQYSPHNFEKAKQAFIHLCEFLNELIPEGDYCEIFICWLDDEREPMEHQAFIDLKNPVIEPLKQYEQCYIKFSK